MATYRPSFVDVSGLTAGLSRGLEMAAQQKRQEDQLAEARIDDFLKTYQPGKLRQMDIPDFTTAYNNYKNAALTYSKINRGGGKAEDLSASKAMMDRAQAELNSVYQNSANAANKHAEYIDYFRTAKSKGYEVPEEVSKYINGLSSTRISDLKVQDIPSAYSFDLVPKEIDYDGISKTLDMSGARLKDIDTIREKVAIGKDVRGNVLYADSVTKLAGRDPLGTVEMLGRIGKSNSKVFNTAKQEYNDLMQGLQNNNPQAVKKMDEIRQYFTGIKSPNDVLPEMVFGLPFYRKQSQGTTIDKSAAEQQYRLSKDLTDIELKRAQIAKKDIPTVGSDYHPSTVINRITKSIDIPVENVDPATGKAKLGYADVSDNFSGFKLETADVLGGNVTQFIEKAYYVKGAGNVKPFFRLELANGDKMDLNPKALNSRIVSAMGDLNYKSGAETVLDVSPAKVSTNKNVGTSGSYVGNDGKTYTKAQLNKLGYTDAQIQEAIKLGNIKNK
jgi:hypothetical protein